MTDGEQVLYGENGVSDYAIIQNFTPKEDAIELFGQAQDYTIGSSPFNTEDQGLYVYNQNNKDLVAVVTRVNDLSLHDSATFSFA